MYDRNPVGNWEYENQYLKLGLNPLVKEKSVQIRDPETKQVLLPQCARCGIVIGPYVSFHAEADHRDGSKNLELINLNGEIKPACEWCRMDIMQKQMRHQKYVGKITVKNKDVWRIRAINKESK